MRKVALLIVCFYVVLMVGVVAQNYISRNQAFQIVKQKELVDTLKNNVYASKRVVVAGSMMKFMDDSLKAPNWNSWFFLIDKHPFADWTHPCKYVFVNVTDSTIIVLEGQKGASFSTDILLYQKIPDKFLKPVLPELEKKSR